MYKSIDKSKMVVIEWKCLLKFILVCIDVLIKDV